MWSARERTILARMKRYLEELESLLGPDDSDVDFRRILEEARDEIGCAVFETFSSEGPSEFLVVCGTRWDKHQKRLNAPWRAKLVFFIIWETAVCVELVGKER